MTDQVFTKYEGDWECLVGGKVLSGFNSKGAAQAGLEVEQRRQFTKLAQQVATEFAKVLRRWLTPNEMREVLHRNKTVTYQNGACASHDFCDANMAMAEAFKNLGLKTICDFDERYEGDVMTETPEMFAASELWNAAWDLAYKSGFAVI